LPTVDVVLVNGTLYPFSLIVNDTTFNFTINGTSIVRSDASHKTGALRFNVTSIIQLYNITVEDHTNTFMSGVNSSSLIPVTRTLNPGLQTVSFTVTDNAANANSASISVIRDNIPPKIVVQNIFDGRNRNVNTTHLAEYGTFIRINFTINDTNWTNFEANSKLSLFNEAGTLLCQLNLTDHQKRFSEQMNFTNCNGAAMTVPVGEYELVISSKDYFHQQSNLSFLFTINDTLPPTFDVVISPETLDGTTYVFGRNTHYDINITPSENIAGNISASYTLVDNNIPQALDVDGSNPYNTSINTRLIRGRNTTGKLNISGRDAVGNFGYTLLNISVRTKNWSEPSIFIPNISIKYVQGLFTIYGFAPTRLDPKPNVPILGLLRNNLSLNNETFYSEAYTDW
jgi:hypothetical protein